MMMSSTTTRCCLLYKATQMQSKRKLKKLIKWGRVHSVPGDIGDNNGVMELMLEQAMTMHHKLISFIGSFQIHMNLLFHGFVSFTHECFALFKHENCACVNNTNRYITFVSKQYEHAYDIGV